MARFDTDRIEVVEDNLGHMFVVDHERQMRFPITGAGQLEGATKLFGPVRDSEEDGSPIFLTGWREGPSVVNLYGGPGGIEEVVGGDRRDPLTGRISQPDRESPTIGGPESDTTLEDVQEAIFGDGGSDDERPGGEFKDAKAQIADLLRDFDLAELIDDAWGWIQEGLSQTEIVQRIRETDAYAERFPGMKLREEAGLPAISESEYIQYERKARQMMQQAGLPKTFYDKPEDIAEFIGNDMALTELSNRLTEGFGQITQAPQEVRDAFRDMFGPQGDKALATFFLDEERSLPALEEAVSIAETSGAGAAFDFDVDRQMAERLVDFGVGFEDAMQGFGQAAELRPLASELAFEREGRVSEDDLVRGAFGVDRQAKDRIERRREARVAEFEGGGSALLSQGGVSGAGSARRR